MNKDNIVVLKGNIVFTKELGKFEFHENSYIIIDNDVVKEIQTELSDEYKGCKVIDYQDNIIMPGLVDTHVHASQYFNKGLGLDKELLPWLETYTFPEERKFEDLNYAREIYKQFIVDLWKNGVTSSVVFATVHKNATKLLLDMFIDSGLRSYVGKVNMDRNCPDFLREDTAQSIKDTEEIAQGYANKSNFVQPIITPRFVPTCTVELMKGLAEVAEKYNLPVQSHLSENKGECSWVKELHPEAEDYLHVYEECGLLKTKSVMAHCVQSEECEMKRLHDNGVLVSHCPFSNSNLSSGISPIRTYLEKNIKVGLGSDVSGGHTNSILQNMVGAIQVSKLKSVQDNNEANQLSVADVFYIATKGGGELFGKVGSFEPGYQFDALIIDDSSLGDFSNLTLLERIERFVYLGDDRNIKSIYVAGSEVRKPMFDFLWKQDKDIDSLYA